MKRLALLLALTCSLAAVPAAGAQAALPKVKHVFVIILENENAQTTFGPGSKAPYLAKTLTAKGQFLPNYYAVTHFSLGNYIALLSGQGSNGDTQGDCQFYRDVAPGTPGADGQAQGYGCVYPSAIKTLADQLTARGLSWKGYMEDMGNDLGRDRTSTCSHPPLTTPPSRDNTQSAKKGDQYATRHNPFVYFHSIIDSPACAKNDVPLTRLNADLGAARTTASYTFITPNLCNDGHDAPCVDGKPGGLVSADAFLRKWVPRILGSPGYKDGGLLLVTFDEAEASGSEGDSSACCNEPMFPFAIFSNGFTPPLTTPGPGGGRVGAVVISPFTQPGTVNPTAYNHFSFLRSVENLFSLDHLGYAAEPNPGAFGSDVFNARPAAPRSCLQGADAGRRCIRLAGVPRGCTSRDFTLRVTLRSVSAPRRSTVFLGGRRVRTSSASRFTARIRARGLRTGRHRLTVSVRDGSGRRAGRSASFRRCARPARFTG